MTESRELLLQSAPSYMFSVILATSPEKAEAATEVFCKESCS